MRCEVCGCKIPGKPFNVIIEGARLTVCGECAKHGKICYDEPRPKQVFPKPKAAPVAFRVQTRPSTPPVDTSVELTEDYGTRIRKAREKLGLSHEELGKRLNEKVSLLKKIETGRMTPSDKLATALEHILKVKLIVPWKEEKVPQAKMSKVLTRELTLGDLIHPKKGGSEKEEAAGREQS
ncbi:MAG TPA: multiprotein bridging factor aMBF1 [Candidatus Acidoferrales bacterium]|nr:multiprotein bridging factor aMBF1 [Candidatus Acidoferrales bacterium]